MAIYKVAKNNIPMELVFDPYQSYTLTTPCVDSH